MLRRFRSVLPARTRLPVYEPEPAPPHPTVPAQASTPPTIELRRTDRTKPENKVLSSFASDITSQFGEDGILREVFSRIGIRNRWCVEFGAWDGEYLSNTWSLINQQNWSAVLIESDPKRSAKLRDLHHLNEHVHVVSAAVGWAGDEALDAILSSTPIPKDFDLVSIDIDGNDWHVWSAMQNYRPRVVAIEFNYSASNDLYFVQAADPSLNQGASLLAMIELGKSRGYELVATTLTNAIFVLAEDFQKIGISDNSIDAMHFSDRTIEIAQGYDGTIFAGGNLSLYWQNRSLAQEDFQMLPPEKRKYVYPGND
ncbi:hypothetical protein [Bradyrhizobium genosp. P]|uniref:hypothetical protein n=1 Tax=Bradyrhizobium genosp. P TaxID=83641 RepID=UPI003CE828DB